MAMGLGGRQPLQLVQGMLCYLVRSVARGQPCAVGPFVLRLQPCPVC